MSEQNVTVTVSTPNDGVTTQVIPVGVSARQQLEELGVNLSATTTVINGEAATLDAILKDGDRVVVARDGKGAH